MVNGERISEARSYVVSNEDAQESETDEYNEADEQTSAAHREVILQTYTTAR